jgi:hypothetical protein
MDSRESSWAIAQKVCAESALRENSSESQIGNFPIRDKEANLKFQKKSGAYSEKFPELKYVGFKSSVTEELKGMDSKSCVSQELKLKEATRKARV